MHLVVWVFRSRKKRTILILTFLLLVGYWTFHHRSLNKRPDNTPHDAVSASVAAPSNEKQTFAKRTANDEERTSASLATTDLATDCRNCTSAAPSSPVESSVVGVSRATTSDPPSPTVERERECSWVNLTQSGPPYFLTVVFIVRIYEKDLSEMTSAEVKQWLLFLRYAGVEHVYLYDLWYLPGESQREPLDLFIREGYLTYLDRHELNPYVTAKSQLPSYQHCMDEFGKDTTWQAAIDIDEYPFSSEDTEPGFMYRFVKKFSEENPDVSEITMNNFLYLGQKNKSRELLIEKLWRHTHGPSNKLVKPIYRPADMKRAQIHHNVRRTGQSRIAPSSGLRMNHYWGARLQNWGPDTPETLSNTEEDRGMEPIVAAFKTCEKYVRKYL